MHKGRTYEKQDMEKHSKSDRGKKNNGDSYTRGDRLKVAEYKYRIETMTVKKNRRVSAKKQFSKLKT